MWTVGYSSSALMHPVTSCNYVTSYIEGSALMHPVTSCNYMTSLYSRLRVASQRPGQKQQAPLKKKKKKNYTPVSLLPKQVPSPAQIQGEELDSISGWEQL